MPLTPLGSKEIGIAGGIFCLGTIIFLSLFQQSGSWWYLLPVFLLAVLFGWVIWFFRDPKRTIPAAAGLIVAPADGTVTHLDEAVEADFIGGKALRCSIFLSIFSVHINRAPAAGRIEFLRFRPGAFHDARSPESLDKNQNQDLGLQSSEAGMPARMVVRQSTGAIARRIICPVRTGMELRRGEKYGMIKFGSRTTLFLSPEAKIVWKVKIGDQVRAGETVLAVVAGAADQAPESR